MQWNEAFRRKVMSADEAVKVIRSGDHVWVHAGCNSPLELTHAMTARAAELEGVEVTHLMVLGKAEYAAPEHARSFRHRAVFTGANVREAVADGRADYVPIFLSEIPRLINSGLQPVDVALIHVSPPTIMVSAPTASASSARRRRRSVLRR
jgi:4-hydroxybutyrate CoA-transferase